jgi:hypothetical protein
MATKDYLWGAEALSSLRDKGLDEHFTEHENRYVTFARSAHDQLRVASDAPDLLQPDDLYVVLRDLVSYDGELNRKMRDVGVPSNMMKKWTSWFTWYVVHEFWDREVANVAAAARQ